MDEYYDQINNLVQDLVIPARIQKTLNHEAYEKLCTILQKIEKEVRGQDYIPRKLAGLLFFSVLLAVGRGWGKKLYR